MAPERLRLFDPDSPVDNAGSGSQSNWHHIAQVRQQQCLSLQTVAREMQTDLRTARFEEREGTDIPLSRLYQWQRALNVPVTELLNLAQCSLTTTDVEPLEQMVHLAKTMVDEAVDQKQQEQAGRLWQMLVEFSELMTHTTRWQASAKSNQQTAPVAT